MKRLMSGTVPYVKTSVAIMGENQIDTFEALCLLHHCKPHQLAADIVRAYVEDHSDDNAVVDLIAARRAFQAIEAKERASVDERRASIRLVR